jgi:hypothetical protein
MDNNIEEIAEVTHPPKQEPNKVKPKLQTVAESLRMYHADYPGYAIIVPSGRHYKEVLAVLDMFKQELENQFNGNPGVK